MTHHVLTLPIDEDRVHSLAAGDTVMLAPTLYGLRDATLIALFDRERRTRFDLHGHAAIHTAPNVRRVSVGSDHPAGFAVVSVGTTTSQRMERFTRSLLQREGVRLIIGKGGLGEDSRAAFREFGGAYLAIVGRAAALQTTWIEAIEAVDFEDLDPECLWRFRIRDFGPLLVAMDAAGGSLYDAVHDRAAERRAAALAALGVKPGRDP